MTNLEELKTLQSKLIDAFKNGLLKEDDCNRAFIAIRDAIINIQGPFGDPPEPNFKTDLPRPQAAPILAEMDDAWKRFSGAGIRGTNPEVVNLSPTSEELEQMAKELEEGERQNIDDKQPVNICNNAFYNSMNKDEAAVLQALANAVADNADAVRMIAKRLVKTRPMINITR